MIKIIIISIAALVLGSTQAAYTIKIPIDPQSVKFYNWVATTPINLEWENSGEIYGCTSWTPNPSEITIDQEFMQTAKDCKQDQVRTMQDREVDELSGISATAESLIHKRR